jgi:methionyl-tRNA synthetase
MLKAAGIDPFRQLNVHGYWQIAEGKMSKSLGNVVEPLALAELYGIDQVRYFFLREMVYGLDASFSEEALRTRINADLANDLGNLFARSLGMAFKYRQGIVPAPGDSEALDNEVVALARETAADFLRLFPEMEFPKALAKVWELVGHLNRYIVATEPWKLAKDAASQTRLDTVLYHLLEGLRFLAVLLRPVMPESTLKMAEHLGLSIPGWDSPLTEALEWGKLTPKTALSQGQALFPRLE